MVAALEISGKMAEPATTAAADEKRPPNVLRSTMALSSLSLEAARLAGDRVVVVVVPAGEKAWEEARILKRAMVVKRFILMLCTFVICSVWFQCMTFEINEKWIDDSV